MIKSNTLPSVSPTISLKTMIGRQHILIVAAALSCHRGRAFNLPNLLPNFKPVLQYSTTNGAPAPAFSSKQNDLERGLIRAIDGTQNGKTADRLTQEKVLSIVKELEKSFAPKETLLTNPKDADILDGDWWLQFTMNDDSFTVVDGSEGDSKISTKQFKKDAQGSISAGGIKVDNNGGDGNPARQSFDVANGRVVNEIETGIGLVTVGIAFRPSESVPRRALAAFDTGTIATKLGVTISLDWIFDLRAKIKGSKESGWIETTYVSPSMRLGRGNKGSLFILTRDKDLSKLR